MTIRHLKIFIAVCDSMNMTAAAKILFMSQSAVSQSIAELERHYGVCLFERLSKKLYLTKAGEKLLGYARHMLRMAEEMELEMKSIQESGLLRVGASVTVGAHVLPKLAARFTDLYPKTNLEVIENNTEQIERLIMNDELDLALVEGEVRSSDLKKQEFMKDELILICPAGHRLADQSDIDPLELEQEKFILREQGSGTRKLFEDTMSAHGFHWNTIWTCSNADTIKQAVEEGLGISVISELSVKEGLKSGRIHRFEAAGLRFTRQFKIIQHKNKYMTEPMRRFTELCLTVSNEI